ncbi:MAG: DUF1836 domain-containing protein [Clostridia bacterium]|nr:DUF1836 domain-containing protein [Clostridia bacterium]
MLIPEEIKAYRCPRWEELPDLELYMDQVMSVLDKNLKVFIGDDSTKSVTPTMINNYVKHKLVRPPKNKRYDRGQIANLYIITLLKQIMSLGEIKDVVECVTQKYSPKDAYNRFCEIFESCLMSVFFDEKIRAVKTEQPEADAVIKSICLAYANMLYASFLISSQLPENGEQPVKEKSKKEKKNSK